MEGVPVVAVVEADGVEDFSFVRDAAGAGADVVRVIAADDGRVKFPGNAEREFLPETRQVELMRIGAVGLYWTWQRIWG